MREIAAIVEKLGHNRWPALILGETGTGKEVIARSIHGVLKEGPFVTIDCSAIVGPLMESELFGHVKGSFTGAGANKAGLIEAANGGTAFFDEIGELPIDMQSKLLRVLQEKEYRAVGAVSQKRSDFRLIAATNRDLAKEVELGTFRRDLFYRLNVVTIRLSPLRERKADIPLLIQYFLQRHGRNHSLTAEAQEAMLSYDWPGNVRQLENCIQRMVALNSGPLLHTIELPSMVLNHQREQRAAQVFAAAAVGPPSAVSTGHVRTRLPASSPPTAPGTGMDERMPIPLSELERRAIIEALEYTKGDRAVAAQLLAIGRTTLYRKIKEYGIESTRYISRPNPMTRQVTVG